VIAGEDGNTIEQRLNRIEALLSSLIERETVKDWYSTAEVGRILGKSGYTVREWARLGESGPPSGPAATASRRNGWSATRS